MSSMFRSLSGVQLPRVDARRPRVEHRRLDAGHGPGLGRAHRADGPRRDRDGRDDGAAVRPAAAAGGRDGLGRRPVRPAQAADGHAVRTAAPRRRRRRAAAHARHDAPPHVALRPRVRHGQRLRHPRPPGLRVGRGRPRRRLQRRRAQLGLVQHGPPHRPRRRRRADRADRHRLDVPGQRRHVPRDARGAGAHPHARARAAGAHGGRGAPRRRLPLRARTPRPARHLLDGVPARRLRHELPDLRLHDGHRVRARRRRLRAAELGAGHRLARRRAAVRPPRPRPHARRRLRPPAASEPSRCCRRSCPSTRCTPSRWCSSDSAPSRC